MRRAVLFMTLVWLTCAAWGQTEYVMDNLLVTDCFGQLVDSGDGEEYGSNENFVFTVELEEDVPILVNFLGTVCIEDGFDFLTLGHAVVLQTEISQEMAHAEQGQQIEEGERLHRAGRCG